MRSNASFASCVSAPDPARLIGGTCRLFDLAVAACGGSPRSIARGMGHDHRTFLRMREVPTLGLVVSIAEALRLDPPAAMAVATLDAEGCAGLSAAQAPGACSGAFARIAAEALSADIDDDAARLELAARDAGQTAANPAEFACSLAIGARALCARGQIGEACAVLRESTRIFGERPCEGLAREVCAAHGACVDAVLGEASLGCPWEIAPGGRGPWREMRGTPGAGTRRSADRPATPGACSEIRRNRAELHALAARAVAERLDSSSTERIRALGRAVDDARSAEMCAWAASIAAIAAARVHGARTRRGLGAHAALSLMIEASFRLEELCECEAPRDDAAESRDRVNASVEGHRCPAQSLDQARASDHARASGHAPASGHASLSDRDGSGFGVDAVDLASIASPESMPESAMRTACRAGAAPETAGGCAARVRAAQRLARTRLARVRLCEFAEQRACEPESFDALLASERDAVRAALVRFPESRALLSPERCDGKASSSRFRHFAISSLDASSGRCWMERVSSAESGVVSAQPRSEESC